MLRSALAFEEALALLVKQMAKHWRARASATLSRIKRRVASSKATIRVRQAAAGKIRNRRASSADRLEQP